MKFLNSLVLRSKVESNILFKTTLEKVYEINSLYPLSEKGKCEALIFFSIFVYTEACNNKRFSDGHEIEEFLHYLIISIKPLMFLRGYKSVARFVIRRMQFYQSVSIKMIESRCTIQKLLYYTFILKPFTKDPQKVKFNLDPMLSGNFKYHLFKSIEFIQTKSLETSN